MDLTTQYLGITLPHPLMAGASPMASNMDTLRQLEDAGCAAIVIHSLFEEQIASEQLTTADAMDEPAHSHPEAATYFPGPPDFEIGPDEYLRLIDRIKGATDMPVFASLNGVTIGGWVEYAMLMEQAGADALELNTYDLSLDLNQSAQMIEDRTIALVTAIRQAIKIPFAVKLSPFYSALPHFATRLVEAGADGLVLFNRFYQPDINVEELEVVRLHLSDSSELLMRLHWLAILSERVACSLAVTGGVHTAVDAIKAVMTGAHAVQMVSALLRNGPQHLRHVREHMASWMEEYEYESLSQMQGSMNLLRCPDPRVYERANYIQLLQSWKGTAGQSVHEPVDR